ncbi:MAG: histidine kinase [Actinomycetota bacterium]
MQDNQLMRRSEGNLAYILLIAALTGSAVVWLVTGLIPAIAASAPALHDWLHRSGEAEGWGAEIARNAGAATHQAQSLVHVVLDYLFSIFNIALGLLLVRLRGRDRTARLLALGMIGTAVAFNLQGHDALQVLPTAALPTVDFWHALVHILSGLAYLFALLLFPDGRLLAGRGQFRLIKVPLVAVLAWVFLGFTLLTVDDHTFGLVLMFGIAIPIAGVASQIGRYRRAVTDEARRQSRVLLWTLGLAFAIAVPLVFITNAVAPASRSQTVNYEVKIDEPGTYFYRCDPHPEDMVGTVTVLPRGQPAPDLIDIRADDSRFDKRRFELQAGRTTTLRFTSFDADLHNVAIYRTPAADDPLFIGKEFSGRAQAVLAFRVFRIVFALMAMALLVALVRFRLWDVERVINRTLLYGALIALITAVYLAVVIGIGTLLGAGAGLDVFLSISVTVVVALAFQPVRKRAAELANRLVYGRRASPYDVLAELADRMAGSFDVEEVIPRLARTLAEGTAARRAEVWLRMDDNIVLAGAHPGSPLDETATPRPLSEGRLPEWPEMDRAVPVLHAGELLGAFTIAKAPGETITPVEDRLLSDVASQAGLAFKNAQLTTELQARLRELRASRQRIVRAQDEERRRLERDIHDGAQQHLVGMSLKLRLAQEMALENPAEARVLLTELQADAEMTLQTLRDLARGVYPPVLADRGLVAALEAHARRCPVDVRVEGTNVERLGREIENAVYFCCLEAIQNAVKHTGRGPITVTLQVLGGALNFSVQDRGPGFDPGIVEQSGLQNMTDRVAALGGTLTVTSEPKGTTIVSGSVPLEDNEPDTEPA